jgi:vacuolar protein sorting-associated protein 13A/C
MNVVQPGEKDIQFISTPELGDSYDKDLLKVIYTRVQKESPDFLTVYDGIDQNVDIKVSTLVFRAAPEPVLALYDFVMTTFVPTDQKISTNPIMPSTTKPSTTDSGDSGQIQVTQVDQSDSKIRVLLKLEGVQGLSLGYHIE